MKSFVQTAGFDAPRTGAFRLTITGLGTRDSMPVRRVCGIISNPVVPAPRGSQHVPAKGAMRKLLILTALSEGAAGLLFLVCPAIVVRLLFGAQITDDGVFMSRLVGISVIALGIACWPEGTARRAFYGMLTYNILAMLYLGSVGVSGMAGILLWPAVAVHAALSILLLWAWCREQRWHQDK